MSLQAHPFDPLQAGEITHTVQILNSALPDAKLRFKFIDIQEPTKQDVIPYIEAERTESTLPPKPARITYTLFHRLDTGAFLKALVNLDTSKVISIRELPRDVQVSRRLGPTKENLR